MSSYYDFGGYAKNQEQAVVNPQHYDRWVIRGWDTNKSCFVYWSDNGWTSNLKFAQVFKHAPDARQIIHHHCNLGVLYPYYGY